MALRPEERIDAEWGREARLRLASALEVAARESLIAAFDWDNTVIHGDVGDIFMCALLREGGVQKPASWGDWGCLTERAQARLEETFAGQAWYPTTPAAQALLAGIVWRDEVDGAPAFERPVGPTHRAGYWMMACMAEALPQAARVRLLEESLKSAEQAEVGATRVFAPELGVPIEVPVSLRVREPMRALGAWAARLGVATWVVSASEQSLVEACVQRLGFAARGVVGAAPQASLERFGLSAEGDPTMTYDVGKRMHIATSILGIEAAHARRANVALGLACGDSDTDHAMLEAARTIVLVDRGAPAAKNPRVTRLAQRVGALRVP